MKSLRQYETVKDRRQAVEADKNVDLSNVAQHEVEVQSGNTKTFCENVIGGVNLPLGLAGPVSLTIDGNNKEYVVPLATTEGALVGSVSRGMKAISLSGGAVVNVEKKGASRGPVFQTGSYEQHARLRKWLEDTDRLQRIVSTTSQHAKVTEATAVYVGGYTFVRFSFDTDRAMGMNMVTIAATSIAKVVKADLGISCLAVAGNFDVDKKPAWMNVLSGRGCVVSAEAVISADVLGSVLKTSAQNVFDVWLAKCMIGSAMSGSIGHNAHHANMIAAFYIATGQDPAHVVEGSLGMTTAKVVAGDGQGGDGQNSKNLYISVMLPAVMVGLIGGGTQLPAQKEALSIIGAENTSELAGVVGGAVLAGELSLLSSIAEGSLADVHAQLGR